MHQSGYGRASGKTDGTGKDDTYDCGDDPKEQIDKQYEEGRKMDSERRENQDAFTCLMEQAVVLGKKKENGDRDWAESFQEFLKLMADCTDADRVLVFPIINGDTYERSFEYWRKDLSFPGTDKRMVSIHWIPEYHQAFCEGRTVVIRDMEELRHEDAVIYHRFHVEGVEMLIAFPLMYRGKLWGYIRIDNPELEQSKQLLSVLPMMGAYLGSMNDGSQMRNVLNRHEYLLSKNRFELEKERQFLDVLCRDYTSVYIVDLEQGSAAMLKLENTANASRMISMQRRKSLDYVSTMKGYAKNYVGEEDLEKFLKIMDLENLKQELAEKERINFRYRSIPNMRGEQYFEVQVVRINEVQFDNRVLIGFHHIDDIIAEEERKQYELQQALERTEASNEVLLAISKIYYEILRIDLEADTYEQIYTERQIYPEEKRTGCASADVRYLHETFGVPEYRERMREFFDLHTLAERLEKDETVAAEYLAVDGNWHTARFIAKRWNNEGKVTHALYVARLISDEKRREKNWIAIAEEANKANAAKTEFISQIAHDIRTPMNAVMGFTEIIGQHPEEPEKVVYGLEKIRTAGKFLQELVDEVLGITRIENGRMRLVPEEVSLAKILSEFQVAIEYVKMGRKLDISYAQHDMIQDRVIVDALRLKQIYTNILSNAVKYTPDGGNVDVEIFEENPEEEKKIRLIAKIRDNGIGMSEEYMEEMYSKFTRATDTRINKVQGHGLGLSIVKELVDLMGGEIQVRSKLGEGTLFEILIDLDYVNQKEETSVEERKEDYAGYCKGMHLLVAEDNELNYEVVSELLDMYEITCDRADDGSVCVEKFCASKENAYDAILMDMQMPVMDGLQATAAIRRLNHPQAHRIPIIAMTANAFRDDIEKCMDAGMNLHLAKPVNMELLLEALYRLKKDNQKKTGRQEEEK